MLQQHLEGRGHHRRYRGQRVGRPRVGCGNLSQHGVEHVVDERRLAGDVAVERVRRDVEPPGQCAHGQARQTAVLQQVPRGGEHRRMGQPGPLAGAAKATPYS